MAPPTRACLSEVGELGPQHVYIGRALGGKRPMQASGWANPFRLWQCASREECLHRYRQHLHSARMAPFVQRELRKLAGKILVCPSCRPGEACHADLIIRMFMEAFDLPTSGKPVTLKVGDPWSPEEFVQQAEAAAHPFDTVVAPDAILRNIFSLLTLGPSAMAFFCRQGLKL